MSSQSAFDALCTMLSDERIDSFPELGDDLKTQLQTDGRGWFFTDATELDPRDLAGWEDFLAGRIDDYFAGGFSGSGFSSAVFSLMIRRGRAMAIVEVAWGVFQDADARGSRASALIRLTNSLMEAAAEAATAGVIPAGRRIIAIAADLADQRAWAWLDEGQGSGAAQEPAIAWRDGGLFEAIEALWALTPDATDVLPSGTGMGS